VPNETLNFVARCGTTASRQQALIQVGLPSGLKVEPANVKNP